MPADRPDFKSDLARLIEPVAKHFWGEPNAEHSKPGELRWGTHGARSISIAKGTWFDHESKEGGGVLDLVHRETGLSGREAFEWLIENGFVPDDRKPRRNGKDRGSRKLVAEYNYTDERGDLLSQVLRYEPKGFSQRKPDGNGGWVHSVQGVRPVPYRLQELQAAISEGRDVFVVEGEKDADRLYTEGIAAATTNAGGAGKWPKEFGDYFADAERVIILPDNDQAGRDHVQQVGRSLIGKASNVLVLELPGLKHKEDVSNWLDHGGTIDRLFELVEDKARPFVPDEASDAPQEPNGGGQPPQPVPRFVLEAFDNITISTKPNYLIKGILPSDGLVVVWGPPKSGKSFWLFDLSMHIALHWPYRGHRVHGGPVVYLALEGRRGFRNRIEAFRRRHLKGRDRPVPFYLISVPVDLVADHAMLIAAIRAAGVDPAMVVTDTLNRAMNGDENKSEDMGKFIRAADAIRVAFDCTVAIVHHCGVDGKRPRGHTSLGGAVDTSIAVAPIPHERNTFTATVEWMKDGEAGTVIGNRLEVVELATDDDGDAISSCVVVEADASTPEKKIKLSPGNELAFEMLLRALEREGADPPADSPVPGGQTCCPVETWRKYYYGAKDAKPETKKKAFARAVNDLQVLHFINVVDELVYRGDSGT